MIALSRVIVVGFDGSDSSRRAVDAAADLAGYGSTLTIVSVDDGSPAHLDGVIAIARERLQSRGVLARYLEPVGDTAEQLLDAAHDLGADIIVLGRRASTTVPDPDSLSAKIARQARCNVLLVR